MSSEEIKLIRDIADGFGWLAVAALIIWFLKS